MDASNDSDTASRISILQLFKCSCPPYAFLPSLRFIQVEGRYEKNQQSLERIPLGGGGTIYDPDFPSDYPEAVTQQAAPNRAVAV